MKVPQKQRKRRRLGGSGENGVTKKRAEHPGHVWSYDFAMDGTEDGRRVKVMPVVEEYTRECLSLEGGRSITAEEVIQTLAYLFAERGAPDYRGVVSKEVFASCDYHLAATLRHWAGRRHPNKGMRWVFAKYWRRGDRDRLEFCTPEGLRLVRHVDTPIKRHVKVRSQASPYDGNLLYWASRLRDHPLTKSRTAFLLRSQRGVCAYCGLLLTDRDTIEVNHIHPLILGGKDELANMQALHRHCHDQKTITDGSQTRRCRRRGVHDRNYVAEEPDDGKLSSPVLETSRRG